MRTPATVSARAPAASRRCPPAYDERVAGVATRVEGRRRGWYLFGLVLSIGAAIFFALLMLGGILGATGSASAPVKAGETFGGDVGLAIVGAIIGAASFVLAVHFEHQLRCHQPAAQAWTATSPPRSRTLRMRPGHRRYSPGSAIFAIVLFTGVAAAMVAGAVITHGEGARSSRVQHHGIPRTATIIATHNHYHSSRGGGYYTADLTATFTPPVQGQTITVVRFPGRFNAYPGQTQQILIDPKNAGYAEIPGSPSTQSWTWIVLVVFAVLFGVLDALLIRSFLKLRRHQREMQTRAATL